VPHAACPAAHGHAHTSASSIASRGGRRLSSIAGFKAKSACYDDLRKLGRAGSADLGSSGATADCPAGWASTATWAARSCGTGFIPLLEPRTLVHPGLPLRYLSPGPPFIRGHPLRYLRTGVARSTMASSARPGERAERPAPVAGQPGGAERVRHRRCPAAAWALVEFARTAGRVVKDPPTEEWSYVSVREILIAPSLTAIQAHDRGLFCDDNGELVSVGEGIVTLGERARILAEIERRTTLVRRAQDPSRIGQRTGDGRPPKYLFSGWIRSGPSSPAGTTDPTHSPGPRPQTRSSTKQTVRRPQTRGTRCLQAGRQCRRRLLRCRRTG
jgi:hypothetical protein